MQQQMQPSHQTSQRAAQQGSQSMQSANADQSMMYARFVSRVRIYPSHCSVYLRLANNSLPLFKAKDT
jgi:hypothetical protein